MPPRTRDIIILVILQFNFPPFIYPYCLEMSCEANDVDSVMSSKYPNIRDFSMDSHNISSLMFGTLRGALIISTIMYLCALLNVSKSMWFVHPQSGMPGVRILKDDNPKW